MITPGTRLVQNYLSATQGQCRPLLSALSKSRLCWVLSVSKRLEEVWSLPASLPGPLADTCPAPLLCLLLLWMLFYQRLSRGPTCLLLLPGEQAPGSAVPPFFAHIFMHTFCFLCCTLQCTRDALTRQHREAISTLGLSICVLKPVPGYHYDHTGFHQISDSFGPKAQQLVST